MASDAQLFDPGPRRCKPEHWELIREASYVHAELAAGVQVPLFGDIAYGPRELAELIARLIEAIPSEETG